MSRNDNHAYYLNESVEILKRAWRISPDDYQICATLGRACESEIDKIRFCTAAVTAKPRSARSRSSLAGAFLPGREDGNLTWVSTTTTGEEKPDDVDPFILPRWGLKTKNNGTIWMGPTWGFDPNSVKAENLRDARADYKETIRLDPSNAVFHRKYAYALILQESIEQAITEFREACRLDPEYSHLHEYAAHRFYVQGRLDLAIVELQEAIRLIPKSDRAHLLLGNIYNELGKKGLAFAAYREALLEERQLKRNGYFVSLWNRPERRRGSPQLTVTRFV